MKLSLISLAVLATAAVGTRVTQSEADDWYDCTKKALKMVDNGKDDSETTCTLFECLWNNAEEYHRGGMFGGLAGVLNGFCAFRGVPLIGSLLE
ncbi:uncharacterized protein N7483_000296 [Penicillium malachiteum]|uniref:uncharacterized protein n=1 Tax=Penicillium malachiteum TaxID=1324776 RepID=UPI00254975AB|nr:uncharacterized protein N7483_000296 [Penicillium malachiteum]KAJ5735171.1 hypothetical protein N7483_000296 [Penicillium malachiteum]